jgi:ActR/RegA family two-component response regulator
MYVEEMLFDLGADAVRMASNVETAMALLDSGMPQFAVLDLNLSGHASYPIARRLDAAAVPYIFLTGYGAEGVDPVWRTRAILQKPATLDLLRQAVCSLLA